MNFLQMPTHVFREDQSVTVSQRSVTVSQQLVFRIEHSMRRAVALEVRDTFVHGGGISTHTAQCYQAFLTVTLLVHAADHEP